MDLRLIALDLDGTTLNSQGKVSPYTKEILEKALSKGILVVIASGRALSAIPEDIMNIRGLKYIITSNGSSIFELPDSRRIYANDMKPGVVMSVLAIMQDTHFPFEVFTGIETTHPEISERFLKLICFILVFTKDCLINSFSYILKYEFSSKSPNATSSFINS